MLKASLRYLIAIMFSTCFFAVPCSTVAASTPVKGVSKLRGTYTGVILLPDGSTLSGTAKINLTAAGGFSAKITALGRAITISGKLSELGSYSGTAPTSLNIGGLKVPLPGVKVSFEIITDATGSWIKVTATLGSQTLTGELRKTK
jgi:hypothetical protein